MESGGFGSRGGFVYNPFLPITNQNKIKSKLTSFGWGDTRWVGGEPWWVGAGIPGMEIGRGGETTFYILFFDFTPNHQSPTNAEKLKIALAGNRVGGTPTRRSTDGPLNRG